jgi:hypothetical protein
MAAVFALVFLPALGAIGFMAKSGTADGRSVFAVVLFTLLAIAVFSGALKLVSETEGGEH